MSIHLHCHLLHRSTQCLRQVGELHCLASPCRYSQEALLMPTVHIRLTYKCAVERCSSFLSTMKMLYSLESLSILQYKGIKNQTLASRNCRSLNVLYLAADALFCTLSTHRRARHLAGVIAAGPPPFGILLTQHVLFWNMLNLQHNPCSEYSSFLW